MTIASTIPAFCQGIQHFEDNLPNFEQYAAEAAIKPGNTAITSPSDSNAVFQTLLAADALRYLTLHTAASKASGHPGGFASIADCIAALMMLGYKNIITEVGHHAPGFYSNMFLDRSLEDMGITTVQQMGERFREMHGLLGHLSGQIPGLLNPAGPLGQGQHFAMAGAKLHPGVLFPVTIGDGGLGEPYIMSSFGHFNTAYPEATNFLPILVWNGYSQEHHSMVSTKTNAEMIAYWQGNGFKEIILVNAKDYDDTNQTGEYVDSTAFSLAKRLAFTQAILEATDKAAKSALGGTLTVLIVKQLKGAGVHKRGAQSHNLYPGDTLEKDYIISALKERALSPEAWQLVRTNFERSAGGPASHHVVTEKVLPLPELGELPLTEYEIHGDKKVATTAMGELVVHVGKKDPNFVITNADGNAASGINNINIGLRIIHPTVDDIYYQGPVGQVYEPLSEDACAGLAVGLALFGARTLWCSYESFAINGLPIWQTVTQAMTELRRPTPSTITLFTAGALEQGRNGWTHQRPEIENYFAAMMRNGNVFPLFPCDANSIQACYEWALQTKNKGITITASKSPLAVRTTLEQTRQALQDGGVILHDSEGKKKVVFAVIGDMTLIPVFDAALHLEDEGIGVKIVSVINPRRLYRPHDVAWETCTEKDSHFLDDEGFEKMFSGDALIGVTGGTSAMLEPLMLRSNCKRDTFAWKRGETTASAGEIMAFNGLTAEALSKRAVELVS
ncbi:phosphoketolase [Aphanothece sacrum]|uniref:D-xylulose 5-phosphate/D-fructose 6-phosphatephosphoketolase n=1 Tax=Aphanothece sacrum FPU1 TaxID=1920663 RepID=A0A401IK46_APHSA|nr:phosphoketolase [Aphanothece sacrum]GBF81594.1 D-xylulose 5-phosphate/D-fructose 6-phosphatephosphoketolase [Aphanothece sacrum FPU1]GBF84148.1 D-xylulose 5-phosphate/D-fructose 6-phosphatephosphoketolase [Aphanothece sacrum FPU3]